MAAVQRVAQALGPVKLCGKVAHGFGRGSKLLGFPTANMEIKRDDVVSLTSDEKAVIDFAKTSSNGIYFAWAQVIGGTVDRQVHKAAVSVGYNPTFDDVKEKVVESWILHDFECDFYGEELRLIICGYFRPEIKFDNLDDLIKAIKDDGTFCAQELDKLESFKSDPFFLQEGSKKE